ncbi:MFS transporter [Alloscardovia criceti]|uniref:MFS transporter n=1 Tax=Alloscardovia criceti TaxID=356828 RepID=UPI000475723B|nr:MFS transporter [Alloscardovia criceti]
MSTSKKTGFIQILPVFIAFLTMAFVDLVGTATNYVKPEFNLSNSTANLFTTMTFFWFLVLSVPTGILMNKIGRRRTVILAIWVTAVATLFPLVAYLLTQGDVRFVLLVISFCLFGVGNALMQVSLNPLMAIFARGDRLASMISIGQFVKAIGSLAAPYVAAWMAIQFGMWWGVYAVCLVIAVIGAFALQFDQIEEPPVTTGKTSIGAVVKLLKDRTVLLCFLAIVAHAGIDVGVNTQAPRILMEHTDIELSIATGAAMVYFAGRMIASFAGGVALQKMSSKAGLRISALSMTLSVVLYFFFTLSTSNPPLWAFWTATFLAGFGNVNVFGIALGRALNNLPDRQNEISGLMIMGLVGGAIIPPIVGVAADVMGQVGGIIVIAICVAYVAVLSVRYSLIEE